MRGGDGTGPRGTGPMRGRGDAGGMTVLVSPQTVCG